MLPDFLRNMDSTVYHSTNYVVLDFEIDTSHGDYGNPVHEDNQMLLACWRVYSAVGHWDRVKWGSEYEMGDLVNDIECADFMVAHNAKYELMWLRRCGLSMHDVLCFDTKLGEYVLLGNLAASSKDGIKRRSTSLDMCCRRRGWEIKDPVVDTMISNNINPIEIPRKWLQGRCMQDVDTTDRLFRDQRQRLAASERLPVLYTRCLLTPVLSEIEFQGMKLDAERVEKTYFEYLKKADELGQKMDEMTGGINWRSTPQVAAFIYGDLGFRELTNRRGEPLRNKPSKQYPDGVPKVDKDTLAQLKATNKRQREFIKLRREIGKVADALSKNLEFFRGVCEEMDGVFKATFNQTVTATHRLSSSGIPTFFDCFRAWKSVQFQNMNRAFKNLFMAKRPGWKIGEADGSQLEFRVAAHLGHCEAARDMIVNGKDVHALSTCVQYSLTEEQLEDIHQDDPAKYKLWRTNSKSWTFQPLYGGDGTSKKQKEYAKRFREAYPGIANEQLSWTYQVGADKVLQTPWGLRFYWPNARLQRDGRLNVKNSVYNYPVQSLATAEIIPIALVFMFHRIKERGLQDYIILVNTVHDSVIAEIHPEYVDQYEEIAIQAFTHDVYTFLEQVYGITFDFVPLGVGVTVGDHWTEGEEKAYNVYRDGTIEKAA